MIDEARTLELYGYTSDSLSKGSHKKVVRICDDCGKVDVTTMKAISRSKWSVCRSCAHSNGKSSLYKPKITLTCQQCGEKFDVKPSLKYRSMFCSKACHNEWMHLNQSGENFHGWKGGLITKRCEICGKEFESKRHRNQKCCSMQCMGEWKSKYLIGEKSANWKGGFDTSRSHLTHVTRCIHLNKRFPGSEGHHIMSGVVIFMPKDLHQSISHNFKSGKNMAKINILAWDFLLGNF